jgi:hypothetical protein
MASPLVTFDFRYGETLDFHLLSARDLDHARTDQGVYAWFLRLRKSNFSRQSLEAYSSVFAAKRLKGNIAAHLDERYEGRLKRGSGDLLPHGDPDRDAMLLASAVFSPAVYIGISISIRSRLLKHRAALDEALSSRRKKAVAKVKAAMDSDDESGKFGQRIGWWLRSKSIRDTNGLFVKVIYLPGFAQSELRKVETYYNRVFIPLFGRR